MKVFKKIIIFSFVTIFCIEASLHLTAFALQKWMQNSQRTHVENGKYKILTLGESTTAWGGEYAYPTLLEKTLNLKYGEGTFKVINGGITGTTTRVIIDHADKLIEENSPDVGIVMTGINDLWSLADNDPESWERSLEWLSEYSRIAKIIRLAIVNQKFAKKNDNTHPVVSNCGVDHYSKLQTKFNDYLYQAGLVLERSGPKEAIRFLEVKTKVLNSNGYCSDSYPLLEKIIEIQRDNLNNPKLALETVESVLKSDVVPFHRPMFVKMKEALREELKLPPDGITYATQTNYWENSSYKLNIQRIIGQFQSRGIPVILMQYPRLPIDPLKRVLISHNGVTFVENEENFEKALKTKKFDDVFIDGFGKVFGHFTPYGSQLVANSAAKAVVEILGL